MTTKAQKLDRRLLVLNPKDNVAVVLEAIGEDQALVTPTSSFRTNQAIPAGHKVAVSTITADEPVIKYGYSIGLASRSIQAGDHVHSDNLVDHHVVDDVGFRCAPPPQPAPKKIQFDGYVRSNGSVGTRNNIALLSTVNCSATVCHRIAAHFDERRMESWPGVDNVFAATHTTGCAMQYHGVKQQMLSRVMLGYAQHPNVARAMFVGLGCEQNTEGYLRRAAEVTPVHAPDGRRLTRDEGPEFMNIQSTGGTRATIHAGIERVERMLDEANQASREACDGSHLILAMECGGSDGYSGLTANPTVGEVADRIISGGGSAVLSETTELY
ncbi:MAG: UxaA family hydrolase, partial [Planctomycetota bacterium]